MKEMGHSESLFEFGRAILKCKLNIVLWEDKTSKCYSTGWTFTHTLNFFSEIVSYSFLLILSTSRVKYYLCTCSLSVCTDPVRMAACIYSTWAARMSGFRSIICGVGSSSQKTHCVLRRFVRNVHHHPCETALRTFAKLTDCNCKYLMLYFQKLLELNTIMSVRIRCNCFSSYLMCWY
jgi:hypothetical protein